MHIYSKDIAYIQVEGAVNQGIDLVLMQSEDESEFMLQLRHKIKDLEVGVCMYVCVCLKALCFYKSSRT